MKKIILVGLLILATNASSEDRYPVMIGGNDGLDACMTLGAVISNKKSDLKVVVYSNPDSQSTILDRVPSGTHVMICDNSGDDWVGVVYSGNKFPDCGLTSPIEPRQVYKGECKSGWVKRSCIEVLAG